MPKLVTVKRNDVGVEFTDTLTFNDPPVAADLTDATEILFILRRPRGGVLALTGEVVGDPVDGDVKYISTAGVLSICGEHEQEWQVTWDDGRVLTFPNEGHNTVDIEADLNPA